MEIKETPIFTRLVREAMSDEEYRQLQLALVRNPELGSGAGVGGLRKVRWGIGGRGKSGGIRIIYYWVRAQNVILMLYLFPKNELTNLTAEQKRILLEVVKWEYP
jgi:mRNA-degrading endonuclease RelE of RelBE toxin-antitoxin system